MAKTKQLKYFKNITGNSADFYVYGELVDEKEPDFWTGEISNTAVDPNEMKDELDDLKRMGVTDFNIMINSPGGSVFAASTIVSMLKRFRTNNRCKIHAFIDGLCASAATYLAMVADDVNIYKNSIFMIHKPMTFSMGNADDLQKDIDTLNTIENDMMIPMYMDKAKVSEDEIRNLIADETWFNGNEKDDLFIGNFFKVNYLDEAKAVAACASPKLFKNYKHLPEELKYVIEEYDDTVRAEADVEAAKDQEVGISEKETTTDTEETSATCSKTEQVEPVDNSVEKPVDNLDYSEFDDIIKNIKR